MKKLLSILLLLVAISPLTVYAAEGDTGKIIKEDSPIVMQSNVSNNQNEKNNTLETKIGTDFYLIVDSDSAGYVTFWVTDTKNQPIKDAQLHVYRDDTEEFFGTTDQEGFIKTYLPRGENYRYDVEKVGYNKASDEFSILKEEEFIHIILDRPGENTPHTGDDQLPMVYGILFLLSISGIAVAVVQLRKKAADR